MPDVTRADGYAQSLRDLVSLLPTINEATCQINIVKSLSSPVLKNTRYIDITADLATHLKKDIETQLRTVLSETLSMSDGVKEFDFHPFADGRIAALAISRIDEFRTWFDKLPMDDAVRPLSSSDDTLEKERFSHIALTFSPNGETLRIFRGATSARLIKQGILATVRAGAVYDYVDPKKSIIIDTHIDFFEWDGTIYVLNYKRFENIIGLKAITIGLASGTLNRTFKIIPVANAELFRAALLTGSRRLNKLASIHNKPHVAELNMENVVLLMDIINLPLPTIEENGVLKLNLDPSNRAHIDAYLHILGDDYLQSLLTQLKYIGIEKDMMGQS